MNDMDSIQPTRAIIENMSYSNQGADIPEQATQPITSMPRQISVLNLINQWQPMGFRVIVNLPFIGDDRNFLFAIRNGPFIPNRFVGHYDMSYDSSLDTFDAGIYAFSYNNMVPVILPSIYGNKYPDPAKPTVTLTNYDLPPAISTFAQSFRRWRGDMSYRLRMIAGFATQGYVIATTIKNVFSPIGIYDENQFAPLLQRQDVSFRAPMMNAYALSDTSMYRHLELTAPYDYPTPYYDQYAWISRRANPSYYFQPGTTAQPKPTPRKNVLQTEPYGDNWIVVGIRGDVSSTQPGSQIIFELEYRCNEGFQFADPFLPPRHTSLPKFVAPTDNEIWRVPNNDWTSDGIHLPTKNGQPTRTTRGVNIGVGGNLNIGSLTNSKIQNDEGQALNPDILSVQTQRQRARPRKPREVGDEEDSDQSVPESEINYDYYNSLSSLDKLRLASQGILGQSSREKA